jgi:hypothetical protein
MSPTVIVLVRVDGPWGVWVTVDLTQSAWALYYTTFSAEPSLDDILRTKAVNVHAYEWRIVPYDSARGVPPHTTRNLLLPEW